MDDSKTVWCGNLSDQVTEELLFELFLQVAPLERVKIPTDREGRQSSFAFITFKHEVSIDYALELLNGTMLFGKPIYVRPRNTGFQNRNDSRNTIRADYKAINQLANLQGNQLAYGENRHGRRDQNSYQGREDRYRDHSGYRKHDDRSDSPNQRRHNYNDQRKNFNDRSGRRHNPHIHRQHNSSFF